MTPVVHFVRLLESSLASDDLQCDHRGRVYRLDIHHRGGGIPQTCQGVYVPAEMELFLNSDRLVCLNLVEVPSDSVGMLTLGSSVLQVLIGIGMSDGTTVIAVPAAWSSARILRRGVSCAAAAACALLVGMSTSALTAAAAVAAGICAFESWRQANDLEVAPFKAPVCYGAAPELISCNTTRPVNLTPQIAIEQVDASQEDAHVGMADLRPARTQTGED